MSGDTPRRLLTHAELVDIAPPEASRALSLALYSLHDLLVTKGILEPGEAAANLRRFRAPGDPKLMSWIATLANGLEEMAFGPEGTPTRLAVVDGGKKDGLTNGAA